MAYARSLAHLDEGKLGPKMQVLLPRQRLFVAALLETGSNNHMLCAKLAGYVGDNSTLARTGHRLAHDDAVLDAIEEESKRRLRASIIMATSRLVLIAENSPQDKDKLKAIEMILNRTGLHALTESRVIHEHTTAGPETIKRIIDLAKVLGLDPVQLLGHAGVKGEIIEGEFKVVEEERSSEGLEDLL